MKGISPLIAVIMLIAFVLVVSGIFYSWVSQFTYSHREEFQMCSKARITLQNAYYTNNTGNITVTIYNGGDVPLNGFTVITTLKGDEKPEVNRNFLEKEIQAKEIGVFPMVYNQNTESILIQSVECKNVQEIVKIYNVDGL
ncbi:MAG: hypothetical protein JSV39_01705 [Candidatus Aenigmatarchaeota archaeon]|nr:MAG: hypothetical protein JSV39_01705 [Candidatus Aenigmarchaeota archaeon]